MIGPSQTEYVFVYVWNNPLLINSCLKLGETISDLGYHPIYLLPSSEHATLVNDAGYQYVALWDVINEIYAPHAIELLNNYQVQGQQLNYMGINISQDTKYEVECLSQGKGVPLNCGTIEQLPLYAAYFIEIFNQLITNYKPAICFIWNALVYPPRALRSICLQKGILVFSLERGLLPGQLVIDHLGINYGGSLGGTNWDMTLADNDDVLDLDAAAKYLEGFKREKKSIIQHGMTLTKNELYKKTGIPSSKRIILYPNQLDLDTNIVCYSPNYKTNISVVKDLMKLVKILPNAFIVVKSHPEDSHSGLDEIKALLGDHGIVATNISMHTLLDSAYAVVVRNSTAGLEAIAYGKPVVALADSVYSAKKLTYDVNTFSELLFAMKGFWWQESPGLQANDNLFPFFAYLINNYHFNLADNPSTNIRNKQLLGNKIKSAEKELSIRTRRDNSCCLLTDFIKSGQYDTDNAGYLPIYDELFRNMRLKNLTLLEIGVFKGGALKLWRDFFSNSIIVGLDINLVQIQDDTGRLKLYQGSQADTTLLDQIACEQAPEGFDIIIDDASHIADLTRTAFWHLFDNHLKTGGIYIIEDWGTGYWPDWHDGDTYCSGRPHISGMVGFVKELVDEVGRLDIQKVNSTIDFEHAKIESLEIKHGMIICRKG